VHLYAIASDIARLDEQALRDGLRTLAADFALDGESAWSVRSRDGRLLAAGVHHAAELSGARRYTSLTESRATWFDGLPVHAEGRLDAHDAAALAAGWSSLEETLEGQFSAVDFDLDAGRVELHTDTLGMSQVFWARAGSGVLVSNSATLIASLLELRAPDPLGASSFLGLGWPVGTHTTTRDLNVLPGGARHTLLEGQLRTRRSFGPAQLASSHRQALQAPLDLAGDLTRLTAGAVHGVGPVRCALTGGKDSRVVAALVQATGAEEILYYTNGEEDVEDVIIARELARKFGLRHEVTRPDALSGTVDWTHAATVFMRQNDGLVSLLQLPDYIDLDHHSGPLGVKLWGMGGEIGRAGTGALMATATTVPLLRRSLRLQRRLLAMKVHDVARLMTAEASAEVNRYLADFESQRLQEGWRPQQLQEAFYTFERIGRWGATGPRRAASADDIFTPFCSRPFIAYCFSLSPGERYLEAAHHRLLSELSPTLREHRLEIPFETQHPRLAPVLVARRLLRQVGVWSSRLRGTRGEDPSAARTIEPEYPFQHDWFEQRLGLMRELFAAAPSSDLWNFVSRPRVEELLAGSGSDRAPHQDELLRATTLFWHFHGPPS
jgi:asparagine synthase (glutamine-hydrolysing)